LYSNLYNTVPISSFITRNRLYKIPLITLLMSFMVLKSNECFEIINFHLYFYITISLLLSWRQESNQWHIEDCFFHHIEDWFLATRWLDYYITILFYISWYDLTSISALIFRILACYISPGSMVSPGRSQTAIPWKKNINV
jgi:hypothetical protein